MRITAEFVTSAAGLEGLPRDGHPEVALVGRSNVGKSSLINALAGQRIARTSAAPGKTRLANVYRVQRGSLGPFYLVDLPGYGYARGRESASEFRRLAREYFGRVGQVGQVSQVGNAGKHSRPDPPVQLTALLIVDARHPGLQSDIEAWQWMQQTVTDVGVVATKVDKLARGERIRAIRQFESALEHSVLPVSAVTDEGLDELWKLIDRLVNSPKHNRRNSRQPPKATAPPPPRR